MAERAPGLGAWRQNVIHCRAAQVYQASVGILIIAYIWSGMVSYPHYIFIASVETICLLLIVGFAWTWRNVEG